MTAPTSNPRLPPGNFGLPLIGETLQFFRDPNFTSKRHAKFGPVFKTRLLGNPTVFIKGPEGNRFILSHENEYFQVSWPPSVKKLLGPRSLALQSGHTHLARRKLLVQAFQPRALAGYVPAMAAISDRYFCAWIDQKKLTWYPQLRDYTLDIACKLLIGLDHGSKTRLGELFESWCGGLFSLPVNLPWTAFGRAWRNRAGLLAEIERLICERQALLQANPDRPETDALDMMLKARDEDTGEGLSIEELKDQVLLLLFAGHETLTSAISSFCLLIAQNPQVMAKARTEQAPFAEQPLTPDLFKQMTYLDQINSTHSDSEVFPNPKDFDPERFAPAAAKLTPFSHLPFGGGLRECLGKEFARLEMKIFAARLLREYQWTLLPGQDLSMTVVPTPIPRDGLKVRFERLAAYS